MPRHPGAKIIPALDAPAIARLVNTWMSERNLTQEQASKRLGVNRSQVSKLCRGQIKGLGSDTFEAMARALPGADGEVLQRAILTPAQGRLVGEYAGWLAQQVGEIGGGVVAYAPPVHGLVDAAACPYDPLPAPVDEIVRRLRCGYPELFDKLVRAVERWGEPERTARLTLSRYRIAAPLHQAGTSGGVERQVDELEHKGELGAYVAAAIRAECILLRRPGALERVQRQLPARARKRERRKGLESVREMSV